MRKIIFTGVIVALMGCAANEGQIKEAIHKNPKIVFDMIEENPEQFIAVVNRAAQAAQSNELKKRQGEELKNPKQPDLDSKRRLSGDDSAKIVVVEYADFQCPACGMAYASLKELKKKYPGQIQFFYKNMPLSFHKMAYPAATYYEAVFLQDRAKAAKFYEYVFENQRDLSDAFLKQAVTRVGANLAEVEKDRPSPELKKTIAADMAEFEKFGFTGTPMVLINGVALAGARKVEELERVLKLTANQ